MLERPICAVPIRCSFEEQHPSLKQKLMNVHYQRVSGYFSQRHNDINAIFQTWRDIKETAIPFLNTIISNPRRGIGVFIHIHRTMRQKFEEILRCNQIRSLIHLNIRTTDIYRNSRYANSAKHGENEQTVSPHPVVGRIFECETAFLQKLSSLPAQETTFDNRYVSVPLFWRRLYGAGDLAPNCFSIIRFITELFWRQFRNWQ